MSRLRSYGRQDRLRFRLAWESHLRILHKHLDLLAEASMKDRPLGYKIVAVILGGSTFLLIIPCFLFLVGHALERFLPVGEWRLLQYFSFLAICFGLPVVAWSTLSLGWGLKLKINSQ